ncbi:hypothetical protein [Corynebacterium xerosis]|uniref:hypothetical protein n=1 Tax=Corynebacterium xerosis TaxID=1725 RepID=UPI00366AA2CC
MGPTGGSRASGALIGGITVAVIALMLVAGVSVGMWLNGRDSGASGGSGGDGPIAPVAQSTTVAGQQAQPETVTVTEEAREDAAQTRHADTSAPRTWSSTPTDLDIGRAKRRLEVPDVAERDGDHRERRGQALVPRGGVGRRVTAAAA